MRQLQISATPATNGGPAKATSAHSNLIDRIENDIHRMRRTIHLLISMGLAFCICWLPLNILNTVSIFVVKWWFVNSYLSSLTSFTLQNGNIHKMMPQGKFQCNSLDFCLKYLNQFQIPLEKDVSDISFHVILQEKARKETIMTQARALQHHSHFGQEVCELQWLFEDTGVGHLRFSVLILPSTVN